MFQCKEDLPHTSVKDTQNAETQMALAQMQVAYDAFVRSFAQCEQTITPQYFDQIAYNTRSAQPTRSRCCGHNSNVDNAFVRGPTMKYVNVNLPGMSGCTSQQNFPGMPGMTGCVPQQNLPPFNTFCDNNSLTKILSLIFECVERVYPNAFERKNILDNFDVLFATEFMKNILNELFCEQPNLIKTHIPLLKYCNVSFLDKSLVPLFVYICHIGGTHYQKYVEKFDLTSPVAIHFNTITYLLHTLKNSNDVNVICYLLDHIKKIKTEQEIYTIFKQCPVSMHVLESPFFDTCIGKKSCSVEKPTKSFTGFDVNESNNMNIKNPTYDLRSDPQIIQQNTPWLNASSAIPHDSVFDHLLGVRQNSIKFDIVEESSKTVCDTSEVSMRKLLTKLSELKFPFDYFVNMTNILTDAYEKNRFTLFEYLLKMNVSNINARDDFGRTILVRIITDSKCFDEKQQYLNVLLDNKDVDTSIPNNLNQTPLLLFMKKYLVPEKLSYEGFHTYINADESLNKYDTTFQWHADTNILPKNVITPVQQVVIESMGDMGNFAAYPACFENQPFCDAKPVVEKVEQHDTVQQVSDCMEHEVFMRLLNHPTCNPNIEDVNGDIPFFHALTKKNICTVKDIMESDNFDIEYKYSDESTPIIKLIKLMMTQKSFEGCEIYFHVLDKFVTRGASLDTVDLYGKSALMYVSESDNNPIFRKLLSYDISTEILTSLLKTLIDNDFGVVNVNLIKKKIAENISKIHRKKWFYFF
jgi:ankyrin repeat protein